MSQQGKDRSTKNPYTTEIYSGRTVRLELSRTARAFGPTERIWDRELHRMFSLIKEHVGALRSAYETRRPGYRQDASPHSRGRRDPLSGPLLSIAIFGTYGSGKSSLLKTFAREARSPRGRDDLNKPQDQEIYSLPVVEPNLTSKDDHFLYSFLATALEEDLKQHQQENTGESAGAHTLSPVQQAFEKVSEYLQVIDSKPQEHTYDPLGLSLERLDRHTSDLRLREALSELIDTLADNLAGRVPRSVLILPVDDADMSLEKLRLTLDTYRRYLLHPRLVPVFSFTGRLAEELMQVHFAGQVEEENRSVAARTGKGQHRSGVDDRQISHLSIAERLALQYLVKLFPIRNRILVGYAPARVQAASFATSDGSEKVLDLLEAGSHLLFGHPQWPIAPRVRLALRPSTLRRQLQILDAMHDAEVHRYMGSESGGRDERRGWLWTFTSAAWSLLNVHRDVLRELDLHMEELLSWTPRGLRNEILRILLAQDEEVRRLLLRRWRYRIEDRRAQVLSLLAMTVFRPQMPGDELSGEDPDRLRQIATRGDGEGEGEAVKGPAGEKLSYSHAAIWFLDLWFGFYLPQILGRLSRSDLEGEERQIISVGWNLKDGANSAISRATSLQKASTTGMMLLHPELFNRRLDKLHDRDADSDFYLRRLFIDLWCFYGYKEGSAWSAISLWRGLGLIGQIIEDFQRLRAGKNEEMSDEEREDHRGRIRTLLQGHLTEVSRLGVFGKREVIRFKMVDWNEPEAAAPLGAVTDSLQRWVERLDDQYLDPLPGRPESMPPDAQPDQLQKAWSDSFIRRLHGEYLLGELWARVGGTAFEEKVSQAADGEEAEAESIGRLTARGSIAGWRKVLLQYFNHRPRGKAGNDRGDSQMERFGRRVLGDCPLFFPWFDWEGEIASADGEPEAEADENGDGIPEREVKAWILKPLAALFEDEEEEKNTLKRCHQRVNDDLNKLYRQVKDEDWDRSLRDQELKKKNREELRDLAKGLEIPKWYELRVDDLKEAILDREDPTKPDIEES